MDNNIKFRSYEHLSDQQLFKIAEYDNAIPALYDPTYSTNEKNDQDRVEQYKNLTKPFFFQVAFSEEEIVGFHILQAFTIDSNLGAKIVTLWTHPLHRKIGIARRMKSDGIEWARNEQMKFIQTGIHNTNFRMQEINKKNGYEVFSVIMRMKL